MKHGRRHNKLKEQTYRALGRKKVEGYHDPYRPIDATEPDPRNVKPREEAGVPLAGALDTRSRKRLAWMGVDTDEDEDDA